VYIYGNSVAPNIINRIVILLFERSQLYLLYKFSSTDEEKNHLARDFHIHMDINDTNKLGECSGGFLFSRLSLFHFYLFSLRPALLP